jgi:hypothetical protein
VGHQAGVAALRGAVGDEVTSQVDGRNDDPPAQLAQARVEQLLRGRVAGRLEQVRDRIAVALPARVGRERAAVR